MANQWLRLYAEFATDPKVQMLSEADQRRYIMLLCLRCNGNETLHDEEVAFQLRISNDEWKQTKERLITKNLINEDSKPTAWDERQYISDSSTERVARHRKKKKQECNVTVTPPDTDTDTDTEKNTSSLRSEDKAQAPKIKTKFSKIDLVNFGIDPQKAAEFLQIRKDKKQTLTPSAWAILEREAAKLEWSMQQVIDKCIERSWAGFRADWVLNEQNQARGSPVMGKQAAVEERNARVLQEILAEGVPSGR